MSSAHVCQPVADLQCFALAGIIACVGAARSSGRRKEQAPSSSGLGRHPLKVEIAGSNPAGVTNNIRARGVAVNMEPCQGSERGFKSRRARQKAARRLTSVSLLDFERAFLLAAFDPVRCRSNIRRSMEETRHRVLHAVTAEQTALSNGTTGFSFIAAQKRDDRPPPPFRTDTILSPSTCPVLCAASTARSVVRQYAGARSSAACADCALSPLCTCGRQNMV